MTENKKIVLVVGAGDATGGAIAKRFAREGYVACVTRRSADKLQPLVDSIQAAGGEAHGFACDARKEDEVIALIEQIESELGPIEAFVFNIGANVPCSILEETPGLALFGVVALVEVGQHVLDGGRFGQLRIAGMQNCRCAVGFFVDQVNNAMTDRHRLLGWLKGSG